MLTVSLVEQRRPLEEEELVAVAISSRIPTSGQRRRHVRERVAIIVAPNPRQNRGCCSDERPGVVAPNGQDAPATEPHQEEMAWWFGAGRDGGATATGAWRRWVRGGGAWRRGEAGAAE